jgi:hypothetical protein
MSCSEGEVQSLLVVEGWVSLWVSEVLEAALQLAVGEGA